MTAIALALLLSGSAECSEETDVVHHTVSRNDTTFAWTIDGDVLRGRLTGPTTGWVAVGFNDRPGLAESLLVMTAVTGGEVVAEEHVARPPAHPPRVALGGRSALSAVSGDETGGVTTVEFTLELDNGDGVGVALAAGMQVYLTLAWSRADDFGHHSAMRTALTTTL